MRPDIEGIRKRAEAATPGPWEWRDGVHTDERETSEAGGLHTRSPITKTLPDGRVFQDDNVVFPAGKLGGNPYWLERFQRVAHHKPPPLTIALEVFASDADKKFIAAARQDIPDLLVYVEQLERVREAADLVADIWRMVKYLTLPEDTVPIELRFLVRLRKELDALAQPAEAGT